MEENKIITEIKTKLEVKEGRSDNWKTKSITLLFFKKITKRTEEKHHSKVIRKDKIGRTNNENPYVMERTEYTEERNYISYYRR